MITQNYKSKVIKILLLTFILNFYLLTFTFLLDSYARTTAESLTEVEKLFMEGKYERVVTDANKLIDAGAHGREELFYLKALSQIQLSRFKEARGTFDYMIERYPRGKRVFDGYIGIGDSYFSEGKYTDAVASYTDAMNKYPDHKNTSVAYYKIGSSYQRLGNAGKAKEYFDKIKKGSPLSFESKLAPKDIIAADSNVPLLAPSKATFEAADTGNYFYLQAGYFKSKNNAQKLTDKLHRKGYDSYMATQIKGGRTFYRVKIGRFKSRTEAESLARSLKADGYKTKICQ